VTLSDSVFATNMILRRARNRHRARNVPTSRVFVDFTLIWINHYQRSMPAPVTYKLAVVRRFEAESLRRHSHRPVRYNPVFLHVELSFTVAMAPVSDSNWAASMVEPIGLGRLGLGSHALHLAGAQSGDGRSPVAGN